MSGGDGGIEFAVGTGEPLGPLVVEIGQRALGEFGGRVGIFFGMGRVIGELGVSGVPASGPCGWTGAHLACRIRDS